ncbi:SMP-30/gluconolactonase/LRE family protein [Gimesia aquarii]|uniref:L-arabinolactonase n=1 Tax=Gimesia aquarii TaxID=2527964 RepID=A0A517WYS2_9PLAN|nr:SMP-30/gluconolactonase/LRE family protein [Gimesia aquarii]QDU10391.1 L-arabinolactonase [Gimesia aquarii]
MSVKSVFDSQDVVGESIIWDDRNGNLIWIDIVGKCIHRLQLTTGQHKVWPTPDFITSLGLREDKGAIVSLSKEICWWDFDKHFTTFLEVEPDQPDNRINECMVAPDGSYWVGTMQNNLHLNGSPKEVTASLGAYYRVTPNGELQRLTENIYGITNTMAWADNGRFLTADSLANKIYTFRYDDKTKTLSDRNLFAPAFERGSPDGSCLDDEGFLWNCRVAGGGCLVRYAPDGSIDRIVDLPCTWPTSCTFGGDNLETLFVTSARFTMSPDYLNNNPHEGNLWALKPGVRGQLCNRLGSNSTI